MNFALFNPRFRLREVLEEVLLRFEEVARLEHHVLGLGQDREVQHACLGVRTGLVDARKLGFDGFGDRLEQLVAHRPKDIIDACLHAIRCIP